MTLVCLIFGGTADARRSAAARAPFDTRRILWIAAHPDDELLIAPLLGSFCVEQTSRCSIVVLTRGENGPCELPGGCSDLGSTREQELRAAAVLLHATLTQWSYPDAMSGFATSWPHDELVTKLRSVIAIERPTVVITFDPSHGSTGHPAHEETGALAIEAASGIDTWLVETAVTLTDRYRFENARPGRATSIDARSSWHWLTDDAAIHASQFSNATVDSLRATPDGERVIYIARP